MNVTPSRSKAIDVPRPRQSAVAFKEEIVGLEVETPEGTICHDTDEGIRYDATMESIASVKLLQEGGVLSAASASQICDGASAVLVVSERALKDHGLKPLARIHNLTVTGGDPVIMLEEPAVRDRQGVEARGDAHRRDRPVRGQRGVRAGADGVAAAHRGRSRQAERQWRRDPIWGIRSARAARN